MKPWHATEIKEVLSELETDEEGLSPEESKSRRKQYGPNEIPGKKRQSALRRLAKQFQNILIYILIAAAIFAAFLQEWVDMAVVLGVVVINAVIGFIQEGKAERALESIRGMLSPKATVLRRGKQQEIEAGDLVPGDIVLLKSGDRVPADLRVLEADDVQADESFLTGESEAVTKQAEPVNEDEELGNRKSMAYSGSIIRGGRLRGQDRHAHPE